MYILSQVSVGIGMVIDLIGKVMRTKKLLLVFMAISSVFYSVSYILLKSYLPAIMQILFLIRAIWYMVLDEKNKKITYYLLPFFLVNSVFVVSVIFFWEGYTTIFLIVAMFILTFCLMFKNLVFVKTSLIINSFFWCAFNFTVRGYVNMCCDILSIVLLLISLLIYDILPKIKEKRYLENNSDIKNILKICKSNLK